jgi:hypothetical protein
VNKNAHLIIDDPRKQKEHSPCKNLEMPDYIQKNIYLTQIV